MNKPQTVDLQIYEPSPDKPGYLRFVRNLSYNEAVKAIKNAFGSKEDLDNAFDYFYPPCEIKYEKGKSLDDQIPTFRRAIVYTVTGSNEGDYIHGELWGMNGERYPLFLAKTFSGRNAAWTYARKLADILEA